MLRIDNKKYILLLYMTIQQIISKSKAEIFNKSHVRSINEWLGNTYFFLSLFLFTLVVDFIRSSSKHERR